MDYGYFCLPTWLCCQNLFEKKAVSEFWPKDKELRSLILNFPPLDSFSLHLTISKRASDRDILEPASQSSLKPSIARSHTHTNSCKHWHLETQASKPNERYHQQDTKVTIAARRPVHRGAEVSLQALVGRQIGRARK